MLKKETPPLPETELRSSELPANHCAELMEKTLIGWFEISALVILLSKSDSSDKRGVQTLWATAESPSNKRHTFPNNDE